MDLKIIDLIRPYGSGNERRVYVETHEVQA
jgi:hypothetical protein